MRRVAGIVLAGVAVSVLAACGGRSSKQSAGSTPNNPSGANGLAAYTTCLSQHGVTLPSFSPRARPSGRPTARPSARPGRSPGASGFGGGFGGGRNGGFGGGFGGNADNPPQGVDASTWKAALAACQSVRPTFNAGRGQNNTAFTAYRNCLSDHGVNFSTGPNGMPTGDPKVAAALKTCAPLRPTTNVRPRTSPSPNS